MIDRLLLASFWCASLTCINPAYAEENVYSFVDSGKGVTIVLEEDFARLTVMAGQCLADLEGTISVVDDFTLLLTTLPDQELCQIILKDDGSGTLTTTQGPGCSYYHGAACGFGGEFQLPQSQRLTQLFNQLL